MKKHFYNRLATTILLLGGGLVALTGLTSCENFLNGGGVRKEIEEVIAYNNAQSVTVYLKSDTEQGEFLSDGEKSFKIGYDTLVQFSVNQNSYVFEKLEAVTRTAPYNSRSEYVQFTPVEADSKKGIYKINVKILKQTNDIMIRPVCTPLPKIQSVEPDSKITAAQDSKILITFNKSVDPASFGNFSGLSITSNGIPVNEYFATPEFFNNNTTLSIVPLAATDVTKLLLPPDESVEIREIQVSYIFSGETDSLGNAIKGNLEHKYRINKDFGKKKTVKVLVEAESEQGKFLSSGLTDCTVNYTFDIQFTVKKSAYNFTDFEAVSMNDDKQSRMSSVEFENKEYDDETGVYKARVRVKDTPENNDILIRPVCCLIPKITSIMPALEANGCNQDSVIKISFNKKMNPQSFKDSNGKINGISITTPDGDDLSSYFEEPFFTADNKILCLQPLCITDDTKYLLAPDGSKNSLNIEVNYTFVNVKDDDGLSFIANGTHSYKINKNFNEQEEVTVLVQNSNAAYGSFLSSGEKKCIVGFGFDIEFTLNKETYLFQGFEAVGQNDESRASYVSFENQQFDEESGIYKAKVRVIQAADDIIIRPNCQIITNTDIIIIETKGTKSITPASGTTVQSFINRNYSINFEPDEDYEFIRWELYDINKDDVIPNGTYVTITNPYIAKTTYKVTQVPANTVKLGLRVAVAERPQLISNTPQNGGNLKDSTIQVIFDRDMDEMSIYYTDPEIKALRHAGVQDSEFLPAITDVPQKHYGYVKSGKTYFKNILLTNNKGGENLNDKFKPPFFENPRTLSIPANKEDEHTLDDYTQVLVTIEKDFFYSEPLYGQETKPVSLRGSKKWMYQVTNHGDEEAPVFQKKNNKDLFSLKLENTQNESVLASTNVHPVIENDGTGLSTLKFMKIKNEKPTLYCDMELQDVTGGSGPNSTFAIKYERIIEADYISAGKGDNVTGSFTHEYTYTTTQDAIFKGDLEMSLPADGVYRIWFDFTDRSDNHFYYPETANDENSNLGFYVVKDVTSVSEPSGITVETGTKDLEYKVSWTAPENVDYDNTVITVTGGTEALIPVTKDKTEVMINNIDLDKEYIITITHYDYIGNEISSSVPKFITGFRLNGNLTFNINNLFFADDSLLNYGISPTAYFSDGTQETVECTIPVPDEFSTAPVTIEINHKYELITKTQSLNGSYYIAKSDALTQKPVTGTGFFHFGDFPQTIAGNDITYSTDPIYNGWYLGSDGYFYAKCITNPYKTSSDPKEYQYSNKEQVTKNATRHFKVEPINWRTLTTNYNNTGTRLLLAEKVLLGDIAYYGSTENIRTFMNDGEEITIDVNNYKYSNIRAYLNGTQNQFVAEGHAATEYDIDWSDKGFLQTAFTPAAQEYIAITSVDNSPKSTAAYSYISTDYACDDTLDKIFLLSLKDVTTTGFLFDSDPALEDRHRKKSSTDYAKANYVWLDGNTVTKNYTNWVLRSPYTSPYYVYYVCSYIGKVYYNNTRAIYNMVTGKQLGISPALCLDPSKWPE